MPVRPRRQRQHRLELTRARYLSLAIGPGQHDQEPLELLHEVWKEHRYRFGPDSWASQFWEVGHDVRLDDVYDPASPSGCPGCDDTSAASVSGDDHPFFGGVRPDVGEVRISRAR